MTGFYLIIIAIMLAMLFVVIKGNRNLLADNRRKDATIRTLRTRIRNMEHGR